MPTPTLSVVMANYNHARHISAALAAILEQSSPPLEVIVVDDASRDDSVAVIEAIASRNPCVRLVRNHRNRGVILTTNRGVAYASGSHVYLAASDDKVLPGFFEKAMRMAQQYPEAGIIFGGMVKTDPNDQPLQSFAVSRWPTPLHAPPEVYLRDYLEVEPPTHSLCAGTIYRRDCFLEVGGYRPALGHWTDTFASRAIGLKYGACYLAEPVVYWRYDPNSFSHSTPPRTALKIVARAARLMRSPAFRDRFPETHVRAWEEGYRETVLSIRLAGLPRHRQALEQEAQRGRILPWLRKLPGLDTWIDALLTRWVNRRLAREERMLHRLRAPHLKDAGIGKLLCEFLPAPARHLRRVDPSWMVPDEGKAYRIDLDRAGIFAPSDEESASQLKLLEDGQPLRLSHQTHGTIREQGEGRYSHWGHYVLFATRDNSDPRTNGRVYSIRVPQTVLSWYRALKTARLLRHSS